MHTSTPLAGPGKTRSFWFLLLFLAFALLLYGNTVPNDYCLDDTLVIKENAFTKKGFSGIGEIFANESFTGFFGKDKNLISGGRYRPLSIASFAIEYQFFGLNPHVSHFINILLYAFTGYLIFLILSSIWPEDPSRKWYLQYPLLAALLFMIHPVHTEVVANIKGRDEIMALLFGLLAMLQTIRYQKNLKLSNIILASVYFLLALFSKEHALAFLIFIPCLVGFFMNADRKQILKITGFLIIPAFLFLMIRQAILGQVIQSPVTELLNNSYLGATVSQHFATVFYTLGKYIQLLIYPYPLTYDYYPYHISLVEWNYFPTILSLLIYGGLLFCFLFFMKSKPLYSFGILAFIIPLLPVSNLFFPIGTFMSERFIYMPSLGFCMIAGYFLSKGVASKTVIRVGASALMVVLLLVFSGMTISRNQVWKNDLTLFTTDAKTSSNSAKGNCAAGGILLDTYQNNPDTILRNEKIHQAIAYLRKAIQLHPTYADAWLMLGNAQALYSDSLFEAEKSYEKILTFSPQNEKAIHNLEYLSTLVKKPEIEIHFLETVLKYDPGEYRVLYKLGNIWGKELNNLPRAAQYLEQAIAANPSGKEAMKDLGVAYALQKEFQKSRDVLQKLIQTDSTDADVWINLGLTYTNLKEIEKANQCFEKAKKLQSRK